MSGDASGGGGTGVQTRTPGVERGSVCRSQRGHQDSWESLQGRLRPGPGTESGSGWGLAEAQWLRGTVQQGRTLTIRPKAPSADSAVHAWSRELSWLWGGSLDWQLLGTQEYGAQAKGTCSPGPGDCTTNRQW